MEAGTMTEEQWLSSSDPQAMLNHFRGSLCRHGRRLRLYAAESCRAIWHLIPDERSRLAVQVAERYADGLAGEEEREATEAAAQAAHKEAFRAKGKLGSLGEWAAVFTLDRLAFHAARTANRMCAAAAAFHSGTGIDYIHQIRLLKDVFGNPFRPPPVIDPAWLSRNDGHIFKLVTAIYDDRAFDRLPALADALEAAGCADAELLGHLRGPGTHVRGCWGVDVVLGKA
jgi:hypothetical protein